MGLAVNAVRGAYGEEIPEGLPSTRFALAEEVRLNMNAWCLRPVVPERPAALPNDHALVALQIKKRRGEKLTKEDKATGLQFGAWRSAVLNAECEGAARLRVLLWTVSEYQALGCPSQASEVLDFALRNYALPSPIPDWRDHRALLLLQQRLDVLSTMVRYGEYPRGYRRPAEAVDPGPQADRTEAGPGEESTDAGEDF